MATDYVLTIKDKDGKVIGSPYDDAAGIDYWLGLTKKK